ncbi:MAG: hypothetical protein O2944_11300, partial [Proteobacteria bacterium]|nr:hypothetical protein [Pseudomonadota bacterium]
IAETPLPATPKLGAKDAFIPRRPAGEDDIAAKADPLAEAAMINGGKAPTAKTDGGKGRGSSLFELVTGTGRAAFDKMTGQRTENEPAKPLSGGNSQPKAERTVAVAAPSLSGGGITVTGQATAQDRLAGLDPEDRLKESEAEDLLDIPAFLRRQAN